MIKSSEDSKMAALHCDTAAHWRRFNISDVPVAESVQKQICFGFLMKIYLYSFLKYFFVCFGM